MRIQLLSDLHLEANPAFVATPDPEADLLVLAGDIGSYQTLANGHCMDEPDWGLRRFSPRPEYAAWPVPVVFVPGNHEYDAMDWEHTHTEMRSACERLGIHWLEREVLTLGSVRLIGTTLWTDFDAVGPRDKAFRAANFYLSKMGTTRHGQPFDAQAMRALGLDCQDWLRRALHTPFDGTTVVITHFAPTLHSADPRYGRTPGTAGFCNAMDDCLPLADVWMHGHLHCPQDQQLGRCHLIANPLGYAHKNEQAAFAARRSWRVTPA